MPRCRVKICGLMRACDARAAAGAGADALGVILSPGYRRSVTPEAAAEAFAEAPAGAERVGVFVDADAGEIAVAVARAGLTEVQLHGAESPELCAQLREALPGVRVVKTFHVGAGFDPAVVEAYRGLVDAVLLDTLVPGEAGGTGATFDWSLAGAVPRIAPVYLAGGLGPDNIADAVRAVRPDGVDVSSGVEEAPGTKSDDKMRAFVAAVRAADAGTDEEQQR